MSERYRYQNELAFRASDSLPFVDKKAVKQASQAVITEAMRVKTGEGNVLFPYALSPREEVDVLKRLDHMLRTRVSFLSGIRMEEGTGTLIQINERRG